MKKLDALLQGIENEAELKEIKAKLDAVEAQIRERISEMDLDLLLEWDTLWGDYADFCLNYIFHTMIQQGLERD